MKKIIPVIFVLLSFIQLNAIIEESANLFNFFFSTETNCAYSKWESHIVEGIASEGYNMYAPYDRQTDGFGQFTLPSEAQTQAWEQAVDYFFAGQYNQAHTTFVQNSIPYSVVKFTDGATIYYMLRENLNNTYIDNNGTTPVYDDEIGSFDFGWGIFVYRTTSAQPIVVSAPHPNDDFISPNLAVKSFIECQAQYLMINGSGREVMWSEYGNYNNSKSLSDPSRNYDHPFNYVYKKACDKIREDYNRRELSVQIHSYDWDCHPNRASCQISPGQGEKPAGLPIRDHSSLKQDVIQNTPYIVVPEGTIGNNEEVTVLDYYSIYNDFAQNTYHDSLMISNNVDLPGYSNSYHALYSTNDHSKWDVFSPFFHVEFDELPNCYPQNEESFNIFYGYNAYTNNWNNLQKYVKMNQYYQPFLVALGSAIDSWIELDDDLTPEAPLNLRRSYGGSTNALAWDSNPGYDFYSYEILYSLNPIAQGAYSIIDRSTQSSLAWPLTKSSPINNLQINQTYYIAMRAVDYNGNVSPISEEFTFTTLPITTSPFEILADNNSIDLNWTMNQQQNCVGFEIYRRQDDSEFTIYESYISNSDFEISSNYTSYSFSDVDVELDHTYAYRVNVVNNQGQSSQISQIMNASLANYITLSTNDTYFDRAVTIGKSYYASDGYDVVYDQLTDEYVGYLAISYDEKEYLRSIISEFDPTTGVRYFDLVMAGAPNILSFSLDTSRNSERFYLLYNDQLYSLNNQDAELSFEVGYTPNVQLIWGNLQPKTSFPDLASQVYYHGDLIELAWSVDYPELVESIDLYFRNDQGEVRIVENLPPGQTTYSFTNQTAEDYRMLNLCVKLHSLDGQTLEYKSFSRFVLVSEIASLNLWSADSNLFFAYPFTSEYQTADLSGFVEAFTLGDATFNSTETLTANSGYFLNVLADCQLAYNGSPILQDAQYQLVGGWNLIHNPHPFAYQIQDILFEKNGIVRSFKNAQAAGYILPTVMGIREGCYTSIDTLRAFESAFLFKTNDDLMPIRFDPVNKSESFQLTPAELFFTLEFKTATGAKDELTVGIQAGLMPFLDDYYDFMKPPLRPTYGIKEAYIVSEEPLSNYYPKMHTKLQEPGQTDSYSWDLAFTNTLDTPVQVRIKETNNSENYPLDLHFAGDTYRLSNNFTTLPNTNESGTYFADLTLLTVTENSDYDVAALSQLQISPNPISRQAKIKINNTRMKDFSVTIYNLKGQKVKSFNSKDCKTDNSLITWDLTNNRGKRVSSGVYFVKYKDSDLTATKKICVIK